MALREKCHEEEGGSADRSGNAGGFPCNRVQRIECTLALWRFAEAADLRVGQRVSCLGRIRFPPSCLS